ncbi:MAG: tetratricopeptide repeat protein [Spirochaetes bacterium]|nr:tetratricopeptide repeat protein [Spirochaetota bacterium]MBU1081212.1 tetratricopeptide repeat protein [Spirochaetota bacterium]
MLRLIRRLFQKPSPPPPQGSSPEELRLADFSSIEASGFEPVDEARYAVRVEDGALALELRKGELLAWADAGSYRYGDVSVEAEIRFGEGGARRSAGLMLRKLDDSSFVYVLVSSDGEARLDAVFNGEPRAIVPWTACPWAAGTGSAVLSVVSRGPRLIVMVNGRFALEAEDDSLDSGRVAFVAQTYDGPATFALQSLRIDSRPVEAEADYIRFARIVAVDPDQRRRLAEGFFALGYYVPALVQLRKVADRGDGSARDKFLEAECLLRLELLDEAAEAIDACLALDPSLDDAVEERYNLLYLRGDYGLLRLSLEADETRLRSSPRLANLLGHAHYNQGSWAKAAEAYGRATLGDPGMPIYSRNRAMALENSGDLVAASAAWLAAAKGFYEQEAWDDVEDCSRRLRERGYDKAALDSLDGLAAYGRGDMATAKATLTRLVKKGAEDAPAAYVYGLVLAAEGKRADATRSFKRAVELDPEKPIYRFRLAESLFVAGEPCRREIEEATLAAPGDGWTLNLAGQAALAGGDAEAAAGLFLKAAEALPEEPTPASNLSQALSALGRHAEAVAALGDWPARDSAAANRLGNALAAQGRIEEAAAAYELACSLGSANRSLGSANRSPGSANSSLGQADPDVVEYRINLAAAFYELDRLSDAEEVLRSALEQRDDPRALRLMGDIAGQFGDIGRAELAYRAALEREPGDAETLRRLAEHYLSRRRYERAAAVAEELAAVDPEAAASVEAAIRAAAFETISCAACGIEWEAPKPVPAVPRSRLKGEPPDDSPAGSCPECGKAYCVACRKDDLSDGRFTCPDCGTKLNLSDDRIRWIVLERVKAAGR